MAIEEKRGNAGGPGPNESIQGLRDRLAFLGLDSAALAALQTASPVVNQSIAGALDKFYGVVSQVEAVRTHFNGKPHMDRAKSNQIAHWNRIVSGRLDEQYIASVRRIGLTHARIGLEPRWYIGGYALIVETLMRALIAAHKPTGLMSALRSGDATPLADQATAFVKAVLLDMDYAITVYLDALEAARVQEEQQRKTAEEQAAQDQRKLSDILKANSEESERRSVELGRVLKVIGDGLSRLAAKDLAQESNEQLPAEYLQLQADLNAAIGQMASAMSSVKHSTQSIQTGAIELATASDDLARRTEQQAANLEQTSAALAQVSQQVDETAELATNGRRVVGAAVAVAQTGGDVINRATHAMRNIEASSNEISSIIGVIDEIAFQTNLLALNAGVEAARAGDAGRGFAVVASEVRALALRSADAARQIKGLIATSTSQVGEGVKLVAETGTSLNKIISEVSVVATVVDRIVAGSQQQSVNLKEVTTAIGQLDIITQRNAAMVEEATAASHSLRQETEQLGRLVEEFNLRSSGDSLRSELRKVAPHAFRERPAESVAKPNLDRSPQPQLRAAAGSGGSASAAVDQGWEEF